MRSAPSVVYPVGRCVFHGLLLLVLSALGLAVLIGWAWDMSDRHFGKAIWLGLGLWAMWSVWAFKVWWRTPVGALHWDSLASPYDETLRVGAWLWHTGKMDDALALQAIESVLDCQSRILLRLKQPAHSPTWIWVERDRAPALWSDLRRALRASSDRQASW
ncbi:MAG: hypothetical protein C0453_19380 [Comamonadaceae bacterium]|nr:hypothetical protein [Comamonadaceae bacterium]